MPHSPRARARITEKSRLLAAKGSVLVGDVDLRAGTNTLRVITPVPGESRADKDDRLLMRNTVSARRTEAR